MWKYVDTVALAKSVGFPDYEGKKGYLGSDHWRNLKRLAGIRGRAGKGRPCIVCGSAINVYAHHIRYRNLLDVIHTDLAPMCHDCHEEFHLCQRRQKLDTIDIEVPEIIRITKEFQATDYAIKRRLRIGTPKVRRQKQGQEANRNGTPPKWRRKMKQVFNQFLRHPSVESTEEFCKMLTESVGTFRTPKPIGKTRQASQSLPK